MRRSTILRRSHLRERASLSSWIVLLVAGCHAPAARQAQAPCSALGQGAVSRPAAGQPPISTDRPGLLFAPTVVPRGRLQVELGSAWTRDEHRQLEVSAWTFPVAVRYGATDVLELRATLPAWTAVRVESMGSDERDAGFADTEVGAKLALPQLGSGPLAFLGSLRVPSGSNDLTSGKLGGSAFLLHGRNLGASAAWFQAMLGLSHVALEEAPDSTSVVLAALLSHAVLDGWSAYVEAATLPGLDETPDQSYAGAGLTWALAGRLQLDLSADLGLEEGAADLIAGFGLSWFF